MLQMLPQEFTGKVFPPTHLKMFPNIQQCNIFLRFIMNYSFFLILFILIIVYFIRSTGVWVAYKEGVYDITSFISNHPGGDQILLAAGSSIEPFWMLYAAHNSPEVYEMLEKYRIGNLNKEDSGVSISNMEDPYSNDPKRHPILKPTSVKPFNAEPPASIIVDNGITPK